MTYDYRIAFLTQYDRDLIPKDPVTFRHPLQVGDIVQLEEDGEFHMARLITHSPSGLTLWLSGKGQNIEDLLLSEPEFTNPDPDNESGEPLDVVIAWQNGTY